MKIGPNEKHEEAHIRGHVNIFAGFLQQPLPRLTLRVHKKKQPICF